MRAGNLTQSNQKLSGNQVKKGEALQGGALRELQEETSLSGHLLRLWDVFSGPLLPYSYPDGNTVSWVRASCPTAGFTAQLRFSDSIWVMRRRSFKQLPNRVSKTAQAHFGVRRQAQS